MIKGEIGLQIAMVINKKKYFSIFFPFWLHYYLF